MDGGNREEAERWLYTANKLLSARDLHGARSFAMRARECDPRFDATELLIAVIDTLMAAEARISEHHLDWYNVLQVLRYSQNIDYIASQYRRLTVLLDPHRNPFAFSAYAFSLVHDAWSVLSNPTKKAIFDNDLRLLTEPPPPPPPPPPQPVVAPPAHVFPQAFPILHSHQNLQSLQNNHHQNIQNQLQQQQQQQQVQEQEMFSVRRNPRPKEASVVAEVEKRPSQDNVTDESTHQHNRPARPSEPEVTGSFWTACPYCYVMYEYQKVYEECTLRCQSCRRAFHAVAIRSPPDLTGKDGSFCSWGFIPLGFSGDFKDISGSSSKWNPFSPLIPCPLKGASNRSYQKGPWVFYDDDAVAAFVEHSDTTSDDSDDEDWRRGNTQGKKRTKRYRKSSATAAGGDDDGRRFPTVERPRRGVHANGAENDAGVEDGEAVEDGNAAGSAPAPVAGVGPETSKKAATVGSRRRGAGNMGKLDLNVEFSNEVEEPAHGTGQRNGNPSRAGNTEDNIEGIGFFEGLDEFLSSLPILNVVADDKVKGH